MVVIKMPTGSGVKRFDSPEAFEAYRKNHLDQFHGSEEESAGEFISGGSEDDTNPFNERAILQVKATMARVLAS